MKLPQKSPGRIVVISREITVVNKLGLHARPAAEFVRRASGFRSEIWIVKDGKRFSAASLIEIMRANLECGTTATIEAKGVDAEIAVERLARLLPEFAGREED
jgi:phosphocarrier protein HPr